MKVLLIVLAVLLLLLLLPFGAVARYEEGGVMAWVKVLFFRFQVFPAQKEKRAKKEKKKKKEPKGEKPKEDVTAPKEGTPREDKPAAGEEPPEEAPKEERKKGGTLELIRAALPLVKPALVGLKKRLTIDDLELHVTWGSQNPADAAMGYGYANAALGTLWAVVDENFKVKKSRLGCDVDFDQTRPTVYASAALSINLWKTLTLVLPLLIRFYRNYSRLKKAGDKKTKKEA